MSDKQQAFNEDSLTKTLKIYSTLAIMVDVNDGTGVGYEPFVKPINKETLNHIPLHDSFLEELDKLIMSNSTDLAEYADAQDGDTYFEKLHKVTMSIEMVGETLYGVATCEVDKSWTNEDTKQLKDFLTAEYADGWGEGIEQQLLYNFISDGYFTPYENEDVDFECDVYAAFWQDKDFKIMTEEELLATEKEQNDKPKKRERSRGNERE